MRPCPQRRPYVILAEAGKAYFWCRCGRSERQPFCDGSHKQTGDEPVRFESPRRKYLYLCGCKRTSTPPYCDMTHRDLNDEEVT